MDNKKIVKYSLIGLLAISLSAGAISLGLRNDNTDKGTVTIESSEESKKETNKETQETQIEISNEIEEEINKEIEEEINKEIEEEIKKIEDKGLSKEEQEKEIKKAKEKIVEKVTQETKPSKPTKPNKPKENKKEVTRTTETKPIAFKTIDKFAHTNGKSRVYQEGRNGERTIVKEDGKIVSNTITRKPQDKIIERYVKVQDKKTEIREVEDKSKPIYEEKGRNRWFVNNDLTGEKKYFYSAGEAEDYFINNGILGNWGTAEPEVIKTDKIIGYHTKTEEVVVQEEKWEWKH